MASTPQPAIGYAARAPCGPLSPFSFTRRATGADDVTFKITHCGICHTDLHMVRNDWGGSIYPLVPGHEFVGIVTEVGSNVERFKKGDHLGVGCVVRSCRNCEACEEKSEQYCDKVVWTYSSVDIDGTPTYGGYSNIMVVDQRYCLRVPDNLPLAAAAPLLCAGITVFNPMAYFEMTERGKHFAVVGLGGLGHMAVKFAKAFGLKVTVISTSPSKEKEARELLGADRFINSKDEEQMKKAMKTIDYIIDTVSAVHPIDPLLNLLRMDGKLVLVGLPEKPLQFRAFSTVAGNRLVAGSSIGGIEETQQMLDFCGKNNITATIEKIPIDYVNTAMERLHKGDVKYRFVIDVEGSLKPE